MATRCGFAGALLLLCMVKSRSMIPLSQEAVTEDSHINESAGTHSQDYHYLQDGNFMDELDPRTDRHAWLHDIDPHISFYVMKQKHQPPNFPARLEVNNGGEKPRRREIPVSHGVPVVEETVIQEDLEKPVKEDSKSFIHLTKQLLEKLHNQTAAAKLYLLGQMQPISDGSRKLFRLSKKSVENANEFVRSNVKPVFTSAPNIFVGRINNTYHGVKDLMGAKVKFVKTNGEYLMNRTKKAFEGASKFADKTRMAMFDARQRFFAAVGDNSTEDVEESLHELEEGVGVVPIGGPEQLEDHAKNNGQDAEQMNRIEVEEETGTKMAGLGGAREKNFDAIQPRNPQ